MDGEIQTEITSNEVIEKPKKFKKIIFWVILIIISVAIGVVAWIMLREPVTYGERGKRLDQQSTLQGYDVNADAMKFTTNIMSSYGSPVKTTPYTLSMLTLPGYKFGMQIDKAKTARAYIQNITDSEVDVFTDKIKAELKNKGFTYKEDKVAGYFLSKNFICSVDGLSKADEQKYDLKVPDDINAPYIQLACASVADYVQSAESFKPLYESIVNDTTYQYYEIRMLGNAPIESSQKGYFRLEAAGVSLAETSEDDGQRGLHSRAWFYKTPSNAKWQLLKGSVSYIPFCKAVEADAEAKKAFIDTKCLDTSKKGSERERVVQ